MMNCHINGAQIKKIFIACSLAAFLLPGCKPTESGYRRAYERTVEARQDADADGFTAMGEDLNMQKIIVNGDTIDCATAFVSITPGIGNPPARLQPYCAVAGSFRQRFTATDLCKRLIEAGQDSAFVVQTGKPRYYVVAKTSPNASQAASTLQTLQADSIIPRPGFILKPARL